MKDNKWYRKEVAKLQAILNNNKQDPIIARGYVIQKLDYILKEQGISLHPDLEQSANVFEQM